MTSKCPVHVALIALAILAASSVIAAPAHAVGPAISSVAADGPLRAGAFTQVLHATGSGFSSATMTAVVEADGSSNPGTISVTGLVISGATSVYGQLGGATAPGTYFLDMCIAPKATPSCASAGARRSFTVVVAGVPASLVIEPANQSASAGVAAPYAVKVRDLESRLTQLATNESLSVATATSTGTATVAGVDTPSTGLNPRLRVAGIGTFTVANDTAGSLTQATVSSVGFLIDPVTVELHTDPPPHDIAVTLDEPISSTVLGALVAITGTVRDSAGDPIDGADVDGRVDGVDSGATTRDTTGADGRFTISFTSTSATSGQYDEITVTASEQTHGSDSEQAVVYFTANGRSPIAALTLAGVPAEDFTGSIRVPFTGTASTSIDSAIEVQVRTAVPGATVDLVTTRGAFTLTDDAAWATGVEGLSLTTDDSGLGSAYLHSTQRGIARVTASASRSISGQVTVTTVPSAARDVDVTAEMSRIHAGERVLVSVASSDAFGNPVSDSRVDVALTRASVGRFVNGTRQVTVRTDGDGTAEVEVVTAPSESGSINMVARGDASACDGTNQYVCPVNEPAAGFAAATGAARVTVTVVGRVVHVLAPRRDSALSTNQFFIVKARVLGVGPGARAILKHGRREVTRARVGVGGVVTFPAVRAVGDGVFAVSVSGMSARVQVKVLDFGIVTVQRARALAFSVAPGAWTKGTVVTLTRNGQAIAKSRVLQAHRALTISAPSRPGTYQVVVRTNRGAVPGAKAYVVR